MDFVLADVNQKLVVDALSTLLGSAELKLITGGVPTKDSVYSDFTFPTNTALATPAALTPGSTYRLATGEWAFLLNDSEFVASALAGPETITGYIIQDAATHAIYWGGGLFDAPITINANGQGVTVDMLTKAIGIAGSVLPITFVPDQDA